MSFQAAGKLGVSPTPDSTSRTGNILYTQIPRRKNIQALQRKASKHLDRPASQPPHSSERRQQLLILSIEQHPRAQLPTGEFLRQTQDVLRFALGQARRAQNGDIAPGDFLRGREIVFSGYTATAITIAATAIAGGGACLEQRHELLFDGLGRRARNLLPDDAAHEAAEGVDLLCETLWREQWAGILLDNGFQTRVSGDQVRDGFL